MARKVMKVSTLLDIKTFFTFHLSTTSTFEKKCIVLQETFIFTEIVKYFTTSIVNVKKKNVIIFFPTTANISSAE